jgi:prevent-host-death family protein
MRTINIHEAKTHLSRYVEEAAAGEEIIIAKAGKPIARLIPFAAPPSARKPGTARGMITMSPDFDAPLPEDLEKAFED